MGRAAELLGLLMCLWLTKSESKPLDLRVALFPTWLDQDRVPIEFVVKKSFQHLRQQGLLPPQVSLTLAVRWGCEHGELTRGLAEERYSRNVSAVLGAPCSSGAEGAGLLAAEWDVPLVASSAMTPVLSDKRLYPTLARVAETSSAIGHGLRELFQAMGWSEGGLVGDLHHPYVLDSVRDAFRHDGVHINVEEHLDSDDLREEALDRALERLRAGARVIIVGLDRLGVDAEVGLNATAAFLAQAAKRNMTTPDYVYVLPLGIGAFIGANQLDSRIGRYTVLDGTYAQLSPATLRHVLVQQRTGRSAETIQPFLRRFRNWTLEPDAEELVPGIRAAFERMDWSLLLTMQSYDAAHLYGLALGKCYWDPACDPRSGRDLMDKVHHADFAGATGRLIMTAEFDREVGYRIYGLDPTTQRQTQYFEQEIYLANRTVARNGSNETEQYPARRFVVLKDFVWATADGRPPPSRPECGFAGDECPGSLVPLIGGLGAAAVLLLLAAGAVFYCRQRMLENEVLAKSWEIQIEDLLKSRREQTSQGDASSVYSKSSKAMSETSQTGLDGALLEGTEALVGYIGLAKLANRPVAVKQYPVTGRLQFKRRSELLQLHEMRKLSHDNLAGFVGLCLGRPERLLVVWGTCRKGSLADVLANEDIRLDSTFRISIIRDVVGGLDFLHRSAVGVHGELSADKCLVDTRWTVKLTDYGIGAVLRAHRLSGVVAHKALTAEKLLHVAPEALRFWSQEFGIAALPTKEADVYALGMVLYQVLTRRPLHDDDGLSSEQLISRLTGGQMFDYRPPVPANLAEDPQVEDCATLLPLIIKCWSGNPDERPRVARLHKVMASLSGSRNLVEHMMSVMEKYAGNLEQIVATRTAQVHEESRRAEELLGRMLPASVAQELKAGRPVPPETFQSTTIYFSDIVGFTAISGRSEPLQVVQLLNYLYSTFDGIIGKYDAYKVETIGDAYMVVSGLPRRNGEAHAAEMGRLALEVREAVALMRVPHLPSESLRVRIGLHSGPCAAGVVGSTMPRYCLFGPTVQVASRMEASGEPMRVQVSEATKALLASLAPDHFSFTYRTNISLGGDKEIDSYWLDYPEAKTAL